MKHLFGFIVFLYSNVGYTFQVLPYVESIDSVGSQSTATFKVVNDSDKSLPIEVITYSASLDDNNNEVNAPDSESLFVIPPQVLVKPNSVQYFRVKYLGNTDISETAAFRVQFKQIELKQEQKQSGVNFIFEFNSLLFVSPKGAQPKAQFVQNLNQETISVKIKNIGNKFLDLAKYKMLVQGEKKAKEFYWRDYSSTIDFQFVLPQRERVFSVNRDLNQEIGKILSISFME